eukprot:scaffold11157_cov17-Tisochrysis_lutea.AAC.2
MQATCKKFFDYCRSHELLERIEGKQFSLSYDTHIPRQLGLSGSSALIYAAVQALIEYYGVDIPKQDRPALVLAVEQEELGVCMEAGSCGGRMAKGKGDQAHTINRSPFKAAVACRQACTHAVLRPCAGMGRPVLHGLCRPQQRRPAQMHSFGPTAAATLRPPLGRLPQRKRQGRHMLHSPFCEGSNQVHSKVRQRWTEGDPEVVQCMQQAAKCAEDGRHFSLEYCKARCFQWSFLTCLRHCCWCAD